MPQIERLLTVREVASYLACAEGKVERLARRRLLPAVRVGPRLRFRQEDVERYRQRRESPPGQPRPSDGELLYRIAVAAAGEERLERILAASLEELGRVIVFTGGSIALVEGDDLVIRAAVGPFADGALGLRQPRGIGLAWQVVTTGEPFLSHDVLADGLRPTGGFRSYLAAPLSWRGATIGMLEIDSVQPRAFTADDLALLVKAAQVLSGPVEIARLYARAEQAREQAEAALHQRDALFSIAAHELRTPLTSLLGQAQLLQRRGAREGSLNERNQRSVEIVVSQAQRLHRLILALLDVVRIEQGRLSIEAAPVEFGALLRRVAGEIQPTLESHILAVALPGEPLTVLGDELRLEQVLQNLIANGIRYSPPGSVVSAHLERGDERALLTISDQGIGIPADALPQLFQRFFRAENAVAHYRSGLGIGLYVVREIVALHGGEVEVESVEGQGSAFRISLPLQLSLQ